jgi:golgi phosphoprotein 3
MPRAPRTLHLHEEVLLLALRNDKGTIAGGVMYEQAAGGAILAELILEQRVRVVTEGRSTYAEVQDSSPLGDTLVDEALQAMSAATRRAKLQKWVERFGRTKQLKHRAASALREQGILKEDVGTVLLIFSRRIYPELNPAYERAIVARLEDAICSDKTVDARTSVLVALAHHAGLLKANLDRALLKQRRDRIKAIIQGDAVGKATKQAIDAMHAAIMAAVIIPVIVSVPR